MAFVTIDDFGVPPYQLPNLDQVINTFNDYIEQKEQEVLSKILGDALYQAMTAGLAVVPNPEALPPIEVEPRWVALRDGVGYTDGIYPYKWYGLKQILVPYIHSMWIRDTFQYPTTLSIIEPKAENGRVVNPSRIIVQGYNAFSRMVGNKYQLKNTLYGYLHYSDDLYLDVLGGYDLVSSYLHRATWWPDRMNTLNI